MTPEVALARVRLLHGGVGPFAVAGHQIGADALKRLAVGRGDRKIQITHFSPEAVRWSCVIDGVQAATGASVGRLSLRWRPAELADLRTEIRLEGGPTLTYTLTEGFIERFGPVPPEGLEGAGRAVIALPPEAIFTVKTAP